MRRDCVTQVIVQWADCEIDNFATPFEAERYVNAMLEELDLPVAAWLEDMKGNKKWDCDIIEGDDGVVHLVD